jgi:hypothetical protein
MQFKEFVSLDVPVIAPYILIEDRVIGQKIV